MQGTAWPGSAAHTGKSCRFTAGVRAATKPNKPAPAMCARTHLSGSPAERLRGPLPRSRGRAETKTRRLSSSSSAHTQLRERHTRAGWFHTYRPRAENTRHEKQHEEGHQEGLLLHRVRFHGSLAGPCAWRVFSRPLPSRRPASETWEPLQVLSCPL